MEWSSSHSLAGYLQGLLDEHRTVLSQTELAKWNEKLERAKETLQEINFWPDDTEEDHDPRLYVSMIGTISLRDTNGTFRRISGSRTRHVLGLLTAYTLTGRSCSQETFRTLATDMEDSDEAANYLRIILARLRRLLGADAILTIGSSAPQLNLERLHLDVIEVDRLFKQATTAVQKEEPHTAFQNIRQGLERVGNETILPTLYDEVFDDVRHEFEIRMRQTVLSVVEFLHKKRDHERKTLLLRLATEVLPHDEEIAELLAEQLRSRGQFIEAMSTEARAYESWEL